VASCEGSKGKMTHFHTSHLPCIFQLKWNKEPLESDASPIYLHCTAPRSYATHVPLQLLLCCEACYPDEQSHKHHGAQQPCFRGVSTCPDLGGVTARSGPETCTAAICSSWESSRNIPRRERFSTCRVMTHASPIGAHGCQQFPFL
jgi:hypothetical protein